MKITLAIVQIAISRSWKHTETPHTKGIHTKPCANLLPFLFQLKGLSCSTGFFKIDLLTVHGPFSKKMASSDEHPGPPASH